MFVATDSRSSFHCATPALSQLEDELQHLCHYGRSLILVIGEPGAGRSHVARRLKAALSQNLPTALIAAQPLMTSQQLDQDALRQLGLTQIALVESDLSLAIARAPAGRRTLIIDDAQDLNLHVLRSLLECAVSEREREDPRLTLVLFGDDMLETALAELDYAGLDQNDRHRLSLPAFNADDAQRLVTVWAAAQGVDEPERSRVRAVWQQQQGRPGAILTQLAEYTVNQHHNDTQDEATDDDFRSEVREHGVADEAETGSPYAWLKLPLIGLGVFVLALLLMYQRELNDWISGKPEAEQANGQTRELSEAQRQDLAIDAQPIPTEQQAPATLEIIEEPIGDGVASDATMPTSESADGYSADPYAADSSVSEPIANNVSPATSEPVVSTPAVQPSAPVSKPAPSKTEPVKAEPAKSEPAKTSKPASNGRYTSDEQALLNASPGYFAVQIIGLRDDESMAKVIRQHKLDRGLVYHGLRDGKPWQVLVLAPFADRAAAERARDALPEAVRKGGPWIKSIKAIQDEIKAGKR